MANLVTVSKTVWTDELFMRAPGVTPAAAEKALFDTLREFCKVSGAWRVELWDNNAGEPKPFNDGSSAAFYDFQAELETLRTANGPDYISGDSNTAIGVPHTIEDYWAWDVLYVHVLSYFEKFTYDANPSLSTHQATKFIYPGQTPDRRGAYGPVSSVEGWPSIFMTYNERPGAIRIYPTLKGNTAEGEGFVPWVSLGFPRSTGAMSIPVVFERMWYEPILDGTLGKLLSQQDKPWTNPTLAQYHGQRFRAGMATARDQAAKQFSNAEHSWSFPAWA